MKPLKKCLAFCFLVMLSGCAAGVTSTKVAPGSTQEGFRIKLPAPFIVGRPNPAGEIDWKIEYLPDPDQEYAVHAWTFLARNNSSFTRTRSGLLKAATLDMDTTAVATQLAKSAGVIGSTALDAAHTQQVAARKAAADKEGDVVAKQTILTDKMRALEYAREDYQRAQADVAAAQAELDVATRANDTAAITSARAKLKTAQEGELKAQRGLSSAEFAVRDADAALARAKSASFDVGNGSANKQVSHAPGPVIYRIVENPATGGIALEQVHFDVLEFDGKQVEAPLSQFHAQTWGKKPVK
jgi:hypothetical protein